MGPLLIVGTFVVILVLNTFQWLVKRQKEHGMASRRAELLAEITRLRREAEKFNQPATYFKCAKMQREANAKEKELTALEAGDDAAALTAARMEGMAKLATALKVLVLGGLSLCLWGQTVLYIPTRISRPFSYLLTIPHGRELSAFGAVTLFPWLLLCDKATSALIRAAFPERSVGVPKAVPAASQENS